MEELYIGGRVWRMSECPAPASSPMTGINLSELVQTLVLQRGFCEEHNANRFIKPSLSNLYDPFLLNGMNKIADRVLAAIDRKERILIYGDYDVDGVCATAILYNYLKALGGDVSFYIPDRVDEGYGISEAAIDYLDSNPFDLVITVDCGITARFQVDAIYERYLKNQRQIEIIITDHHQYNESFFPNAYAVVNPHVPGDGYPFKHLCGAGIALKIVQAVGSRMGKTDAYLQYIDLAALATIADIVTLSDENRIIVKYGLEKINREACLGIKALLEANSSEGILDATRLTYLIAPRVNAAGRMGHAGRAVRLMITEDRLEAQTIAMELNESNTKRQQVQDLIFKQAIEIIEQDASYQEDKVLVVYGEGWHHGVIGIVAAKLVERYYKPAVVLSVEGDRAVGSARSIEGFHLFHALEAMSNLLLKFGGHAQAGGLTLMAEDLAYLRSRINMYAINAWDERLDTPILSYHMELKPEHLSSQAIEQLQILEPFGLGNPIPLFCGRNVIIQEKKTIGNGKHLKFKLKLGNKTLDAVWFNKGSHEKHLHIGEKVDLLCHLELNCWQGAKSVQLKIQDLRCPEEMVKRNRFLVETAARMELLDCDGQWLYNGINEFLAKPDDFTISREDLISVYKYMIRQDSGKFACADFFWHARLIAQESGRNINYYKLLMALMIFDELELMTFTLTGKNLFQFTKPELPQKANLEDSELLAYIRQTMEDMSLANEQHRVIGNR